MYGENERSLHHYPYHLIWLSLLSVQRYSITCGTLIVFLDIENLHSTIRFFTNPREGKPGNPPPGTVVDDVVTLPERHDFFLISQSVRQGTVNPTSYNIIHNESGLSPDILQRLTYKVRGMHVWCLHWDGELPQGRHKDLCQGVRKNTKLCDTMYTCSWYLIPPPVPNCIECIFAHIFCAFSSHICTSIGVVLFVCQQCASTRTSLHTS